jgi:endo-1,4-beta-xylanase
LQERHALPDAIGIQSHMHDGPWPLPTLWQTAEDFAQFGRPLHFTEVTVLSGPARGDDPTKPSAGWATTPEGEAAQADYVEGFYTALFSHPAVRAITWWDLSDRGAWRNAPAGLIRKDMSPKPAYERLMKLIHSKWWTDARGETGPDGVFSARAFCGDYRVTVTDASGRSVTKTLSLPGNVAGEATAVEVSLP